MYKLPHSVYVSLTVMNMLLNVLACLLSGCSVWNVPTVNFTLILVITCKFRLETNTGKLLIQIRTVVRNLFLFNSNLILLYSYLVVSMFIYIYIYIRTP